MSGWTGTLAREARHLARQAHDWIMPRLDRLYDRWHGIDTSGRVPAARLEQGLQERHRTMGYEATSPLVFRAIMRQLPIRHAEFEFIDIGSGKGRILLLASRFPFRRVVGVEFSRQLHEVAEENLRRYRGARRASGPIELVCADAATYPLPASPLVLYLFNPFDDVMMGRIMANLRAVRQAMGHEIHLIYCNTKHSTAVEASGLFARVERVRLPAYIRDIEDVYIYST